LLEPQEPHNRFFLVPPVSANSADGGQFAAFTPSFDCEGDTRKIFYFRTVNKSAIHQCHVPLFGQEKILIILADRYPSQQYISIKHYQETSNACS
jgi:hypothetical protein